MTIAITVSTKYDDILDIVLPQNACFFSEWFIITDVRDQKTIDVINKYGFENVKVVYYDFFANGRTFNKGGAIRFVQQQLLHSDKTILLLNSDIYLPDNFQSILDSLSIASNTLYGTHGRKDYYSHENFNQKICNKTWGASFIGYFQLYKNDPTKMYKNSNDCSECDLQFIKLFRNKVIIGDLVVDHLGKNKVNWKGRTTTADFV